MSRGNYIEVSFIGQLSFVYLYLMQQLYILIFVINCLHLQDTINPGLPRPRLFTVGRLDVATTGLIIVTNDGMYFPNQ